MVLKWILVAVATLTLSKAWTPAWAQDCSGGHSLYEEEVISLAENLGFDYSDEFIEFTLTDDPYLLTDLITDPMRELLKLGPDLLYDLTQNTETYLVIHGAAEHPSLKDRAKETPYEGYGTNFEDMVGVQLDQGPLIVAPLRKHISSSINLHLHEASHALDELYWNESLNPEWKRIHKAYDWNHSHLNRDSQESFAEAMSLYFHSDETRQTLLEHMPLAHAYMKKYVEDHSQGQAPMDFWAIFGRAQAATQW